MSETTLYREPPGPLTWDQELALAELQSEGVLVPVEPVAQISVTDGYWGDIHLAPGRYAVVEIGGDDE